MAFGIFKRRRRTANASLETLVLTGRQAERCDSGHFVASALRAAKLMQNGHRRTILIDLAGVLSCDAAELDFLFIDPVMAANDADPVAMPDYRTALHRDMLAVAR